MLTHDRYPVIIFDQMIKCGSSVLMGTKMKTVNIPQGIYLAQEKKMSNKSFHQKTRHTANAYLQDTAKYYGIELSGTIPNCVSCSIKKIRQKNIPKENANKQLVGSKCVFKIKRNGVYRARLVSKGFSQIPGEDFTGNISQ